MHRSGPPAAQVAVLDYADLAAATRAHCPDASHELIQAAQKQQLFLALPQPGKIPFTAGVIQSVQNRLQELPTFTAMLYSVRRQRNLKLNYSYISAELFSKVIANLMPFLTDGFLERGAFLSCVAGLKS